MPALTVGLAVGKGLLDFFGASSANRQQEEASRKANKYQQDVFEFQYGSVYSPDLGGEAYRQWLYQVEGLEITKRNNEKNLQFEEAQQLQRYDYGMGIRDYEYSQAVRLYDRSVSQALQQKSFNELAENAALVDQDRLIHEQLLSIAYDETETLFNYGAAAAGVGLKQRQAKAGAATEAQATRISALKATGAAAARGMAGRSAAKNVQGILAETGARQAAIIDQLMFSTEATDQEFYRMNQQLLFDQAGYETSRESAKLSDTAARNKLRVQRLQADIQAYNMIALVPEIAPPLPKPLALPRPEYQEVFQQKKPPRPQDNVPMLENPWLAAASGAISGAQMGLSIGKGLYGGDSGGGGKSGINFATGYSGPTSYNGIAVTGAFNPGTSGLGGYSFNPYPFAGGSFGIGG